MPKRTMYVREGEQKLWERAEELAGEESLSGVIAEVLERYGRLNEGREKGFGPFGRRIAS